MNKNVQDLRKAEILNGDFVETAILRAVINTYIEDPNSAPEIVSSIEASRRVRAIAAKRRERNALLSRTMNELNERGK